MYKFGELSKERLSTCHPELQLIMEEAIKDSPIDFGIACGYRSPEEQFKLYKKGRSEPGKKVTFKDGKKNKSKHNYSPSLAVDIYAWIEGRAVWNKTELLIIAKHIKQIAKKLYMVGKVKNNFISGSDWKRFKDYPHYELIIK